MGYLGHEKSLERDYNKTFIIMVNDREPREL